MVSVIGRHPNFIKGVIMLSILSVVVVAYVVYVVVNLETTNPFTIFKQASRDTGKVIGATPKTFKAAKTAAEAMAIESKVELRSAGLEQELSFRQGKAEGQAWATEVMDPITESMNQRKADALAKLEALELN
jgi:predicted RNA-binding protein YlqC (UPF0109 family)